MTEVLDREAFVAGYEACKRDFARMLATCAEPLTDSDNEIIVQMRQTVESIGQMAAKYKPLSAYAEHVLEVVKHTVSPAPPPEEKKP